MRTDSPEHNPFFQEHAGEDLYAEFERLTALRAKLLTTYLWTSRAAIAAVVMAVGCYLLRDRPLVYALDSLGRAYQLDFAPKVAASPAASSTK